MNWTTSPHWLTVRAAHNRRWPGRANRERHCVWLTVSPVTVRACRIGVAHRVGFRGRPRRQPATASSPDVSGPLTHSMTWSFEDLTGKLSRGQGRRPHVGEELPAGEAEVTEDDQVRQVGSGQEQRPRVGEAPVDERGLALASAFGGIDEDGE